MNREQLQYFAIACHTRNFAAAARLVPMSAQGFTKSIKSLEAELGVPLFTRGENGMHLPTAYADELLQFVEDAEVRLRQTQRAFRQIEAEQSQRILLGSSLGIMGFLGSAFLQAFKREHPEASISYAEMSDRRCDAGLLDEEYGIAFTLAPYHGGFETVELYSTPICLWVNADDPLSRKSRVEPEDLDGRALALPGQDYKCHDAILDSCSKRGAQPSSVLESSEMFWLYSFAYDGCGVAFSAGHLGELPFFNNDAVKCVPFSDTTWRFGISVLPKHRLTAAEQLFRRFCIAYFRDRFK